MRLNRDLPRGVFVRKGHYWIRFKDQHGKIHREHVGPFLTPAKQAVEKRRSEVRSGTFFPEKIRARSVLVGEIAKNYLDLVRQTNRDWSHQESRMNRLLEVWKDMPIADLTPAMIEGTLADLAAKRKWKPATYNRHRSTASGFFKQAVKAGKLSMNPARETAHRKEPSGRVRYLTAEEEAELLKVIRQSWPEREAEILVALHSGMRRSEQFRTAQVPNGGLKWSHIDFRVGIIRLPRSKSGKARDIPMNSVLRETLRSLPRVIDSPYVFQETDPGKWLEEAIAAAKIEDFHWHDFRHTFASRLVMHGIPIRTVAELMGHTQLQTTLRYAHLAPGHLAQAVECLTTPEAEATGKKKAEAK